MPSEVSFQNQICRVDIVAKQDRFPIHHLKCKSFRSGPLLERRALRQHNCGDEIESPNIETCGRCLCDLSQLAVHSAYKFQKLLFGCGRFELYVTPGVNLGEFPVVVQLVEVSNTLFRSLFAVGHAATARCDQCNAQNQK
jgi:hypothetical protein